MPSHIVESQLLISSNYKQGIIDSTKMETRQIFSRMFAMAKILKSCLPLIQME